MKRFALAGNPNCGKTTLFNSLTASTAYVGNWPGVTVEKREGTYKKLKEPVSIIDLPGIYSLSPYTPEEVISRNFILDEKPDVIINVVDATNLERNLYLTTQLLEIDIPMVIALNMMDEVDKNGDIIDAQKLEELIGVPVVPISALKEKNLNTLVERANETSLNKRKAKTVLEGGALSHLIHDVEIAFKGMDVENPLFHSIKLIELDEIEVKNHSNLVSIVQDYKNTFKDDTFGNDFEAIIADARYKHISKYYSKVLTKHAENVVLTKKGGTKIERQVKNGVTRSDKIDRVLTNKWLGIPVFILILFVIFHITFGEDLFYLNAMNAFGAEGLLSNPGTIIEGAFANGGVASIGVALQNLLVGVTDWFTDVVRGWMVGQPVWLVGFLCDGVLAGLFSILSFLPQILLLFLLFSILEDSGYMARVAFILDRIFRKFGLSGRAFMPMIMGFGCSVPAIVNTRTLADDNERIATIRVIPFFSCGAKLPILTAIAGGLVTKFSIGNADLITLGLYLLGMLTAIFSVLLMRNTTMKGEVPPFIMELPTYHYPQFRALMIHLWDKLKHFIKKAFTIILLSTIFIWFVMHFSWNWTFLEDSQINESILAGIGSLVQPLFTPLGFGSQLQIAGWVFAVSAISGLIAKENVVSTMGVLAACIVAGFNPDEALEGADSVVQMITTTGITVPGLIAFASFNLLTIPCFAACATAKAELPKGKFWSTVFFWVAASYLVSAAIYLIGTWWYLVFAFAAIIIGAVVFIWYRNKAPKEKKAGV